jgi:hypothetical protein
MFLFSDTTPPHPSSFRLDQASFKPNLYLYKYPSSFIPVILLVHTIYEDGTGTVFCNVSTSNSEARESPKRKYTTNHDLFHPQSSPFTSYTPLHNLRNPT